MSTRSASPPLSPLQQALVALEAMQRKLNAAEASRRGPIAVIGMACRFPGGANDPESYWKMLDSVGDGLSEVPADRWDIDALYDPDPAAVGKMITRRGGFLADVAIDEFDAAFFGISQREANSMDPQQRLLLEIAWEALDDAGLQTEQLKETRTSVFVGAMNADYQQLEPTGTPDTYAGPGNEFSFLAGRLAYLLGFRGPNMVVTTACSSSLVALHLACQSLRLVESDTALVGGVNLMLSPGVFIGSSRLGALAPDGRCKTFDRAADGYARGEGCAVLVLKRLADAQQHGDAILAVIRGSAVNHNGASGGLTVPSSAAQQALIKEALAASSLAAADIDCVEAHGTGTSLGDLIEVQALAAVFGSGPARTQKLRLGSVKANIGHLEAASGIAAVIKVILALRHGRWPGQAHFQTPNPHIPWDEIPIEVSAESAPWPSGEGTPRRAGVSSFGLSGINCHLVIEESPPCAIVAPARSEADAFVLPLSARDPSALMELARRVHDRLATVDAQSGLRDLGFTAAVRRSHHNHRLAVSGRTVRDVADQLAAHVNGTPTERVASGTVPLDRWRIVFVFPGQGGQWPGMAGALLDEPAFRTVIAEIDDAMRPHLGWSIEAALRDADPTRFAQIDAVQPLLFAYQVALAALWREYGIAPDAVIGHSFGEVAAAVVAGALDRDQAAALICHRSRFMARASGHGAMALVELAWDQARAAVAGTDGLCAAVCNGPRTTVLSGDPEAVDRLITELTARDVFCRRVKVDVAAHSAQMIPLARLLAEEITELTPRVNSVPFHSTVTGGLLDGTGLDAAYWARNMRDPVQFWPALRGLIEAGPSTFLEIGPHPVLCPSIESALHHLHRRGDAVPSADRDGEALALRSAIGRLYVRNAPLRWEHIVPPGELVPAIPYPWQRRRAWWTGSRQPRSVSIAVTSSGRVPAPFVRLPGLAHLPDQHFWQAEGDGVRLELTEAATVPRERLETLALAAAADSFGADAYQLEDISIDAQLSPSTHRLQMILAKTPQGSLNVTMYGAGVDEAEWKQHATVTLRSTTRAMRLVYEVAWQPCNVKLAPAADAGPTLVLADARGVGAVLVDRLLTRGAEAILVPSGSVLSKFDRHESAAGVRPRLLDLRGLDARADTPEAATDDLRIVLQHALAMRSPARVWVVTCGAQGSASTRAPEQAALWGLARVFALEHPDRWGGLMDLAPASAAEQAEALLYALGAIDDDQIALLDGQWHAARLVRARLRAPAIAPWRADATYLVTGGLGGLGIGLLRHMVEGGARHIVLAGRTPLPPRARWAEQRTNPRIAALLDLEEAGATVESFVADVTDQSAMTSLFASLEGRAFPLRGIVHLAGTSTFAPIAQLDAAALHAVLQPKVQGALVLEALARNVALDFFVLFSSAAGVWGATGQAHYAAANAFLDALARRRRAEGLPGLSIAWGRVAGGGLGSAETDGFLDRLGLAPIPSAEAFAVLDALMIAGVSDRVVAAVDWTRFKPIYNSRRHAPLLDRIELADAQTATVDATGGAARRRIATAPPNEQRGILRDVVAAAVASVLGIDVATTLDPDLGLFRQGMDSIMAIELRRKIERALGLEVAPTVAFEHPSVAQLTEHLAGALGLASPAVTAPPSMRVTGEIDVDAIERMSEAEAEALLLARLDHGATS